MFAQFIQGIKELVFPDNCHLCKTYLNAHHTRQLCDSCLASIQLNLPPFCTRCSRHLDAHHLDGICPSCHADAQGDHPHHYDRAWGVCRYTEPIRQLIHHFKYDGKTQLHKTFIPLMSSFIHTYHLPLHQFDHIAPIPLHSSRLRERGFNQAEILSHALCQDLSLPHAPGLLTRLRPTDTQTVLDQKQRFTNLHGAFKMNGPTSVAERSILLVDDLMTTGATVNAAAACLKDAGAAYVGVLTLAVT